MPLVDSNLAATWASLYREYNPAGVEMVGGVPVVPGADAPIGYSRAVKDRIIGNDHWALARALNLQPGQRIALIGAGFGWVAEDWAAAGLGPIVAVDTSTWIHANKAANATVTILNADTATNSGRNAVRQALGLSGNQRADWAITEDVLPVLSDAECLQVGAALRNMATNVAHWVSVLVPGGGQDARLNWKTLASWKVLMTPDKVVKRGLEGQVL